MLLSYTKQNHPLVRCFLLWATGDMLIQMQLYARARKKRNAGTLLQIDSDWK